MPPTQTPIDAQALASLAPEKLMGTKFTFAPATHVLPSDFPTYSIYQANTVADAPKAVMRPEAMLVRRPTIRPKTDADFRRIRHLHRLLDGGQTRLASR